MSEIKTVSFSDFGAVITGKTPSSSSPEDFGTEIPFITPSDSFDSKYIIETSRFLSKEGAQKLNGKILPKDSVLVTCIGSAMGKIAMASRESVTNQQINSIVINKDFDPNYVYYCLVNNYKLIRNAAGGSTALPLLNKTEFELLKCSVHSLKEHQSKIANVLSTLDAKIELNNRINAELETMAKTLYDYWFVQFDFPFDFAQGKPVTNGKPYKSSGGKMVYNPILKREIPVGWEVGTLSEHVSLTRGVTYGKDDVCNKDSLNVVGILRATNITGNEVDVDDLVYVASENISPDQYLKKFDLLIVMSSGSKEHIGKNGVYYFDEPNAFGAFCSKLSVKEYFLYYVITFLNTGWFKIYIKNQCLGTNINNLTNDHIRDCLIVKPESELLSFFDQSVSALYKKISVNTIENQDLKSLRDWLLPMLMNGQVTVQPAATD